MADDDNYTGHVEPKCSARRRLPGADIVKISVGPYDNNVYVVRCAKTGQAIVIDAANDSDVIVAAIRRHETDVALIVTTHGHEDHWQALAEVAWESGAPTAAHRLDLSELPVTPDRLLTDGDSIVIGRLTFGVIHLRGHTAGSIALALNAVDTGGRVHLFTGDSLFPGGPGRTECDDDFAALMSDLEHKIFARYADDTVVYPGHGDDTTLGVERPQLAEWRARGW